MYIKSVDGKTNTSLSVINGSNKQGEIKVELSETITWRLILIKYQLMVRL